VHVRVRLRGIAAAPFSRPLSDQPDILSRAVSTHMTRSHRVLRGLFLPLFIALSACASVLVPDSTPLSPSQLNPPGAPTISQGGYRHGALAGDHDEDDWIILIALSGGGKRSAAFSHGALRAMRDIPVTTSSGTDTLLNQIDILSGISGGGFTAAYYGMHRQAAFGRYESDFLYHDTNASIARIYLLPWNWTWITDPTVGTNDFMARVYDETMFQGRTFRDLSRLGRPMIMLGATDISFGRPFAFTQEYFDLICADLEALPISRAVAASNGFPGLFSPVTLTNHRAQCGDRVPGWLRAIPNAARDDPLSRTGEQARAVMPYLDADATRYVHLADGGITDNLGLRVAGAMIQVLAAAPDLAFRQGLYRLRRILVISIDGQGTQDSSVANRRMVGGIFSLLGLVSGAQIDRYNFETLTSVAQQLQGAEDDLRRLRCGVGRTIDGLPCEDVSARLVHVSLAGLPDGPARDALLAIPTGLTIPRADVDALIEAGSQAVLQSTTLRQAVAGLTTPVTRPPVAPPLATRPVVRPARAVRR